MNTESALTAERILELKEYLRNASSMRWTSQWNSSRRQFENQWERVSYVSKMELEKMLAVQQWTCANSDKSSVKEYEPEQEIQMTVDDLL